MACSAKGRAAQKRITFPVMVEANAPGVMYWGKTSADYRVFSVPSDVWIDEQGHVARHDLERNWIDANQVDRWLAPEQPTRRTPPLTRRANRLYAPVEIPASATM